MYEWPEVAPLGAMGAKISKTETTISVDWFGDRFSAHASYNELYFQDSGREVDLETHYDFETVKRRFLAAVDLRLKYTSVELSPVSENIIDKFPNLAILPLGLNAESKLVHRFTGNLIRDNLEGRFMQTWADDTHAEICRAVVVNLPQPIAEEITPLLDWYVYKKPIEYRSVLAQYYYDNS